LFRENDFTLKPAIYQILQNPVKEEFKTFKLKDIEDLEDKLSFFDQFLSSIGKTETFNHDFYGNVYHKKNQMIYLKKEFIQEIFRSLIARYHVGYLVIRISGERIQKALLEQRDSLINLGISLLIRFIFIAIFISLFFLKKFNLLFQGVEIIGTGNLNYRLHIQGKDEFGQLSDYFNQMTLNLKDAQSELLEKSRMEHELAIARKIQDTLLPKTYPVFEGLKFKSFYLAQTETGGDYYDFIPLNNKEIAIVIADVSGHGVGACLVMSMIRTLIRSYSAVTNDPKKLLLKVNETIFKDTPPEIYATVFYGVYSRESNTMKYSVCGHHQGIVYSVQDHTLRRLEGGGIALGIVSNDLFEQLTFNHEIDLHPQEIFLQFTDGLTEAKNKMDVEFTEQRLLDCYQCHPEEIEVLFEEILDKLSKFMGIQPHADDITMIGFQIQGL
jgi:serine phosphatase RsbU (regulator of sigma subunit)